MTLSLFLLRSNACAFFMTSAICLRTAKRSWGPSEAIAAKPFALSPQQTSSLFRALVPIPRRAKANQPNKRASPALPFLHSEDGVVGVAAAGPEELGASSDRKRKLTVTHSDANKALFTSWIEAAIGIYRASHVVLAQAKPSAVRKQIADVIKNAQALERSKKRLSVTAVTLFPQPDVLEVTARVLAGAKRAHAEAARWRDGRLTNYAMISLSIKIAHFLRDVLKVQPILPARDGVFGRCVEIALIAAGDDLAARRDFSKTLKRALEELAHQPRWQDVFDSNTLKA